MNNFPHGIDGRNDDMMKQWILGRPWVPNVQTPLKERQTDPSIETWDCADPIPGGSKWVQGGNVVAMEAILQTLLLGGFII